MNTKIAFLGLGAMGQRMVEALLGANYDVTVWNRDPSNAERICAQGAKLASSPRAAAADADFIFSMVRDDKASEWVWLDPVCGAIHAIKQGALAIECSTVSVNHIKALHSSFRDVSKRLIEAPLAGSRPQAEARKLIFFAAGNKQDVELVQPLLLLMGSICHYCGEPGTGVAIKLIVNAVFGAQVAVLAELMGFAENLRLDVKNVLKIISSTPVCSPAAAVSAKAMVERQFNPAFPIDLVNKDFNLLALSAQVVNSKLPVTEAAGRVYKKGESKGYAPLNITGIIQLYSKKLSTE